MATEQRASSVDNKNKDVLHTTERRKEKFLLWFYWAKSCPSVFPRFLPGIASVSLHPDVIYFFLPSTYFISSSPPRPAQCPPRDFLLGTATTATSSAVFLLFSLFRFCFFSFSFRKTDKAPANTRWPFQAPELEHSRQQRAKVLPMRLSLHFWRDKKTVLEDGKTKEENPYRFGFSTHPTWFVRTGTKKKRWIIIRNKK